MEGVLRLVLWSILGFRMTIKNMKKNFGNKTIFQIFSKFSSICQNVAKMATKYFFQIFSKFLNTCQNVARMATKYFFQIFSKFSSAGRHVAKISTKSCFKCFPNKEIDIYMEQDLFFYEQNAKEFVLKSVWVAWTYF